MYLTKDEERILSGEEGYGRQKAMELLVALGTIYDADHLIPITSAHLSGVSYKTIGDGGISFLAEISRDTRVEVPTTLNPAGMDLRRWKEMGVDEEFAERQLEIISYYERMGVIVSCTCTPYLTVNKPHQGDTISWAESSALSYANSVIGARTNREGGPGALAAAIIGKTPNYGLHITENRKPTIIIKAKIKAGVFSHSLLGYAVGKIVSGGIPYFTGIHPNADELKTMAAAMASSGSVAMFHVEGLTPESNHFDLSHLEKVEVTDEELKEVCESLTSGTDPELIALGCPHLSIEEMRWLAAELAQAKKNKDVDVWFCTSRYMTEKCPRETEILERLGKVVCDTCMVVAPIEKRYRFTGTNSAKACCYLPTLCSQKVTCADAIRLLEMVI